MEKSTQFQSVLFRFKFSLNFMIKVWDQDDIE